MIVTEEANLQQDSLPSCRTPVSEVEAYPEASTVTRPRMWQMSVSTRANTYALLSPEARAASIPKF